MLPIWDLAFAQWVPGLFIIRSVYWLPSAWAARIVGLLRHRMQSECYLEKLALAAKPCTHLLLHCIFVTYYFCFTRSPDPEWDLWSIDNRAGWLLWHELGLDTEKDETPKVPARLGWVLTSLMLFLCSPFFSLSSVGGGLEWVDNDFIKSFFPWLGRWEA